MDTRSQPTGLWGLDQLLGGGLPARQTLLIAGERGSGKSVLSGQIALALASRGAPTTIVTLSAEPHQKLLESMEGFTFFQRSRLGKEIVLLSAHPYLRKGPKEMRDVLLSAAKEQGSRMVVVESMHLLEETWKDPATVREFVAELSVGLAANDCIGLFTCVPRPEQDAPWGGATASAVDGIIHLTLPRLGMTRKHMVEVVTLRGRPHARGSHVARVGREGMEIFPRLETLQRPSRPKVQGSKRVPLGMPAVDALLEGGVLAGSSTFLEGPAGAGKTRLATCFAQRGVADGGRVLYVAAGASSEELGECLAESVPELGAALEGRLLEPLAFDGSRMSADELGRELWERLQRSGANRLVVEDVPELLAAVDGPERSRVFLSALAAGVTSLRVTALYTGDVRADSLPSPVRDNLLQLRAHEGGRSLPSQLWVLRVRGGTPLPEGIEPQEVRR